MLRWILSALFGLSLCLAQSGDASADRIQKLTVQLAKSRSAKVRISAALSLAKTDDTRALKALTKSVLSDKSADIRRISAASLGQSLQRDVSKESRKNVLTALKKVSKKDRDAKVRSSAKVAMAKADLSPSKRPTDRRKSRGILVGVSAPSKVSRRLPKKTAAFLQSRVKQVIAEKSPSSVRTAPGTGMPSSKQLKRSGMAGYSIVPNVSKLKLKRKGRSVYVSCEIIMRLSPWEGAGAKLQVEKSATVKGSGSIRSGSSKKAISESSEACIDAVVTQVTANQVVPFLAARAR